MLQCNLGKTWTTHPPRQSFLHLMPNGLNSINMNSLMQTVAVINFCVVHLVKEHLILSNTTQFENYFIKSKTSVKLMEVWSGFPEIQV